MASTKEIKRRIKSIKNTKKITKAMELVAASKMKKAVSATIQSRIYARYSWEVLESLSGMISDSTHPLLTPRTGNKSLVVFITSNRSLCGGYNAQITRKVIAMLKENPSDVIEFVTVGKKGDASMRRLGKNILASFTELPDSVKLRDTLPVARMVTDLYEKGDYDKIYVAYTDFKSALLQIPNVRQLLPVSKESIKQEIEEAKQEAKSLNLKPTTYLFEPNYEELMKELVIKIVRMQIYQMILESKASEESSRMVAMKNASEAAGEMIDDLTLVFNKARQAGITQEISEISAGMASVS